MTIHSQYHSATAKTVKMKNWTDMALLTRKKATPTRDRSSGLTRLFSYISIATAMAQPMK